MPLMAGGDNLLRSALVSLAVAAVLVGIVQLIQLSTRRRCALPGYGWETELTHLVMNAVMVVMLTPLWSATLAWGGVALLVASALLLAVVPALRPAPAPDDRRLVILAAMIHIAAALLMAWLTMRMAPSHPSSSAQPMMMERSLATRTWLEWICACFFSFDLASVLVIYTVAHRIKPQSLTKTALIWAFPHMAMDTGMIVMLLLI